MVTLEEAQQNAYQAWAAYAQFLQRQEGMPPIPEAELPVRYEQYLNSEAILTAREQARWKPVNYGYPAELTFPSGLPVLQDIEEVPLPDRTIPEDAEELLPDG